MRAAGRVATALAILLATAVSASAQGETVEYYGLDALASVRVVFDATGNIVGRMDYGPFGQELFGGTNMPDRRYAGLFRDGEAGLDSAGARSYQSRTGRFTAVDPIYAGLFEPQRWNRYAYALNDPISYSDRQGLQAQSEGPVIPGFCFAEDSFDDCGGNQQFWWMIFGGGGFFGFGSDYARAVENGYDPSMPADLWNGFSAYNNRVDEAFAASVSTEYDIALPDGTQDDVPLECNSTFIRASSDAWMRAGIGTQAVEAGFFVTGSVQRPRIQNFPFTNEWMTVTGLKVPSGTIAITHTHPNASAAPPSSGDIANSDRVRLPFYVLSNRGLYVHNPGSEGSILLRPDTTWLTPCK